MKYELNKGNNSNYEITIIENKDDLINYKESVLKKMAKDVEVPWFRKWQAPASMVEQKIDPSYLQMWIYEEVVHQGLHKILDENKDIKFIGQIYDVNEASTDDEFRIKFKLDVYPQVEEKNKNWDSVKLEPVKDKVTKKEIDQTIDNLKRQYAKYEDVEKSTKQTVSKVKFDFLDEDWNVLDSGSAFVWKEDIQEHPILADLFVWKKKWEKFEVDYDHENFPHILHYHKDEKTPSKLSCELVEVKKVVLPSLDQDSINELFHWEVKDYDDLVSRITETIQQQKSDKALVDSIEKYISDIQESLSVSIPKTLIDEEEKSRMKALEERFWWPEWLKNYFDKISKEEADKMREDIRSAASSSLTKFFILRHITENLGIDKDIDWNTPLDAERKVYDKLVWSSSSNSKKSTSTKSKSTSTKSKSTSTKSSSTSTKSKKTTKKSDEKEDK